ncbi:hypothetical protein D9M71_188130 [compost metagenome]
MGSRDGRFDLLGTGFGDLDEDFGCGRIENGLDPPLARDQFTIDQQCSEQLGRLRASHFASALFFCRQGALQFSDFRKQQPGLYVLEWKQTSGQA